MPDATGSPHHPPLESQGLFLSSRRVCCVPSGGNPLFAVALWEAHGVPALLKEAMSNGKVVCKYNRGSFT